MVGRERKDEDGYTTVNVRMPKSHWLGLVGIALTAVTGLGLSANTAAKLEAQDQPVSREWARKLSEDLGEVNKRLEIVARHDERISEIKTQLARIENRIDTIANQHN